MDDGVTTSSSRVRVNTYYENKVFSIAVEAKEDGYNPNKVIDVIEVYGLPAIPTGVKFNDAVIGKYTAKYKIDFDKRSVEIKGLNLRITN